MDMSTTIFWQEEIEKKFSRKQIDQKIREAILDNPVMVLKIEQGIQLIEDYRSKEYSYESKNQRVRQLAGLDLNQLVTDIFVGIAYCQPPELFTSVSAMLASRLKFDDKLEAIKTIAELIAVLCLTDAFDIIKEGRMGSLMVFSRIPLPEELIEFIEGSACLPPMICEPRDLRNNYDSGYLTHKESLILGSGNHHEGDLCLDVLNTMNKVALKLDLEFLSQVEEEPTKALTTQDQIDNWKNFKKQSQRFYRLMVNYRNQFYLTHKVDKRGRIYCSGYHISSQGAPFKKAMLELVHEELVEVPDEYRR